MAVEVQNKNFQNSYHTFTGTGKLVFVDGSYYEGTFVNGEIDGFGTRFFAASGCKYQGQFEKGELQGKGRMTWPDGSIYEGQWVKNRRQGWYHFSHYCRIHQPVDIQYICSSANGLKVDRIFIVLRDTVLKYSC